MSQTITRSGTETFTLTHAKYLSSKVTADMDRCRQMYGYPSLLQIETYGTELALMLKEGYVSTYEFGYKSNEKRVVSWFYRVGSAGLTGGDQRPGGIHGGVDVTAAAPFNFMTYSAKWSALLESDKESYREGLPFKRNSGTAPRDGAGYWVEERSYSAAGVAMIRKNFRPY